MKVKENLLILYALEEERIDFPPQFDYHYIYQSVGVGKVNAAIASMKAIAQYQPSAVINIGSCGGESYPVDSVHFCTHFKDRDLEQLKDFGLYCEINTENLNKKHNLLSSFHSPTLCSTGDSFVTKPMGIASIYDMEAYAIALVCENNKLPFISIKCISDIVGQNSVKIWKEKLADVRTHLAHFVAKHF